MIKNSDIGAKLAARTEVIAIAVRISVRVCMTLCFDPYNILKKCIEGPQIAKVAKNRMGSFTREEIACSHLPPEPRTMP
jgi:hypothetical protein